MRKLFSKLAVLATALCLILCCGMLAACGDDNPDTNGTNNGTDDAATPENTTYNVTVQLENGTPVENLALKFCILDENGGELSCKNTGYSDAEGKVSITLKTAENYHVGVAMAKPGTNVSYEAVSNIATNDLDNPTFTFTVKVA